MKSSAIARGNGGLCPRDPIAGGSEPSQGSDVDDTSSSRRRSRRPRWRRALLAQRRRFPGSPRAADAAFFLGRLDENGGRGHGPALAWYERYLDEAPRGSYVAEALGRKMIAVEELHGAGAARNVAEQYILRFPHGSYAGAAHALLGAR